MQQTLLRILKTYMIRSQKGCALLLYKIERCLYHLPLNHIHELCCRLSEAESIEEGSKLTQATKQE